MGTNVMLLPSARMHSEGYSSWFVCLSVSTLMLGTTGYEAAY